MVGDFLVIFGFCLGLTLILIPWLAQRKNDQPKGKGN